MPTSLFALVLFICFVTPGFVFEMLRERRRPPRLYSTLRETSVIVVSSVAFSLPALLVMLLFHPLTPRVFPDLQALAEEPAKYSAAHLGNVVALVAAVVVLSTLFALAYDWLLEWKRKSPRVTNNPVWYEVLSGESRPSGAKAVGLAVELKNGSRIEGAMHAHGLNNKEHKTDWIVLQRHSLLPLRSRSPSGQFIEHANWTHVVISADEIRSASVAYLDRER